VIQTLVDKALAEDQLDLSPPPRFHDTTFESYRIDPAIAGHAEAVEQVRHFAGRRRGFSDWFRRSGPKGLYLDGDFGVGKTHLLASSWHLASGSKHYLSFAEAMSLAVSVGAEGAIDRLAANLVCIDEFELDDPSNTRLADLLCDGLVKGGARLIVTSNTVPGELGAGRLFVDQFRAQLVRISSVFSDVHVPGKDYRQRKRQDAQSDPPGWGPDTSPAPASESRPVFSLPQLDGLLVQIPIIRLRTLAKQLQGLTLIGVDTITDQLAALRLVHLIDRLYEHRVPLRVQAHCPLSEIFAADYRDWAFRKKYQRCMSRLYELCTEGTP
jgi:cell division protein ZapE